MDSLLNSNSLVMKVQGGGGYDIQFRKISISWIGWRYFHQLWWTDASRPYGDDCMNKHRNQKLIRVTSSGFQPTWLWQPHGRIHI